MVRGTFRNAARTLIAAVLPIAAVVAFAGIAAADPGQVVQAPAPVARQVAEPVASGLSLEEVATNPEARNSDPLVNGAAAGALAGAAGSGFLSGVSCGPLLIPCAILGAASGALWGTAIGLLVGAVAPGVVPQVLP
ncbi:hypothetical protein OG225_02125 [Nocardia sp. NBC_01377]|uniref:hypothetical protein n=1 Tax=Nocardia sp. NBC_01377 TaxID=2903595 RepID=UPI00324BC97B